MGNVIITWFVAVMAVACAIGWSQAASPAMFVVLTTGTVWTIIAAASIIATFLGL